MAGSVSELRGIKYEVAVDFQGAVRTALLARLSGVGVLYGDTLPREKPARMLYTHQVATTGAHVVEQALSLAQAVTHRPAPMRKGEFPVDPDAEEKITAMIGEARDFAILNPGAGWGAKQWPAERYGLVASELAKDCVRSLVNYGPGEEELAASVEPQAVQLISCWISS
jgi:heptosyltransferase-1